MVLLSLVSITYFVQVNCKNLPSDDDDDDNTYMDEWEVMRKKEMMDKWMRRENSISTFRASDSIEDESINPINRLPQIDDLSERLKGKIKKIPSFDPLEAPIPKKEDKIEVRRPVNRRRDLFVKYVVKPIVKAILEDFTRNVANSSIEART